MAEANSLSRLDEGVMRWLSGWFVQGRLTGAGLAALSGVVLALCFFPSPWWNWVRPVLAWVALAPLFLALTDEKTPVSRKQVAGMGYQFGLLLHLVGAYWLTNIVPDWPLNLLPYISVALIEALWFALFAVVFSLFKFAPSRNSYLSPFVFAGLWIIFEWLRTLGAYAFPWFPLAATQVPAVPTLQILSLTGQWGLSFAIALVAGYVGLIVQGKRGWQVYVPLSLPALLWIGGAIALQTPPSAQKAEVAVAQASYSGQFPEESLRQYLDLAQEAVQQAGKPLDLVVCPESTYWDELLKYPEMLGMVQSVARSTRTSILLGTDETEGTERAKHRYNSAAVIDSDGNVAGTFHKIKIVPLGEFFPFREALGPIYAQFPTGNNDLTPGHSPGATKINGTSGKLTLGMLICYESAFGWRARQETQAGATLLTVITNDAWFGNSAGPLQHADLSCLRAVETGRSIARSATSGESRLIDPNGRILKTIPLLERGVARATLPIRADRTFYVQFGDWFIGVCFLIIIAGVVIRVRKEST